MSDKTMQYVREREREALLWEKNWWNNYVLYFKDMKKINCFEDYLNSSVARWRKVGGGHNFVWKSEHYEK